MGTANTVQTDFRWRNDNGSETSATWKAVKNLGWTPGVSDLDVPIRLRVQVSNTGSKNEDSGQLQLYLDVDGGGYNPITTSSTNGVQMVASGTVSDGTATTEQLAGSQSFQAGEFDSNGSTSSIAVGSTSDVEMEYCFKMDSANLTGGEVLSFRVYLGGSALDGYTNTAQMTAPTPPAAEWTQAEFRIRPGGDNGDAQTLNANTAGDWAAAANTNATLQPSARRHGTVFGLRFKVSAAVASASKSLKIQAAKNGGAYADLASKAHNLQATFVSGDSIEVGVFPTNRFTDGAATTQVLSGSSFVAGSGEHSGTAAAVSLAAGDHTELEWRVFINKTWQGGGANVDGDYFDFRLVESSGTVLTSYTNTPRVTLDYDTNYVGGCYPESIGRYGIFYASDGDAFTFVEDSELTGGIIAMRRATGTTRWVPVDTANAPAGLQDLEGFHVQQDGQTLHLFYTGGDVRYETFNLTTHAWGQLDEQVDTSIGLNQMAFGARRSDGTTVMFWINASDDLVYKVRSSGGTWDVSATTFFTGTVNGAAGVLAASDKVYLAWTDNELTIYSQSLNSSGTPGTQRTISTDPRTSGSGTQWSVIAPAYYDSSGTEKVWIFYQRETDAKLYGRLITSDGAPATEVAVTDFAIADNELQMNSRQAAANPVVDGTKVYVGYARASTDYDLYYTSSDNGGAWDTDTEVADGLTVHAVGLGFTSGTLSFITEEAHIDAGYSGFTGGIQVREVTLQANDACTAVGTTAQAPTTGSASITQNHVLTSQAAEAQAPTVDTPTLTQNHVLSASDTVAQAPTCGSAVLTELHQLTASDTEAQSPVVDSAAISQNHALSAGNAEAQAPIAESAQIAQNHVLGASDSESGAPVVDASAISQNHVLTASDTEAQSPVNGSAVLTEEQLLDAQDTEAQAPVVDSASLSQNHVLTAGNAEAQAPSAESATLSQNHVLTASNTTAQAPVCDSAVLTETQDLPAQDTVAGAPVVGSASLTQGHNLTAVDTEAQAPTVQTAALTQNHVLTANDTTAGAPVVDSAQLDQDNLLQAQDSEAQAPVVGSAAISQNHVLTAGDTTAQAPTCGSASMTGEQALDASDTVAGAPVVGQATISQNHALTAENTTSGAPSVGSAAAGQVHNLTAADCVAQAPVLSDVPMTQEHVLTALLVVAGAFSVGSATLTEVLPTDTSPERIFVVPDEARLYGVEAGQRGWIVPTEDRSEIVER